jgi:putative ABC transport system ATP-binding protein
VDQTAGTDGKASTHVVRREPGAGAARADTKLAVAHLSYVIASRDGDRRAILEDVSLAVPAGRFFTILGPSGSGKSTLLRCINRLIEPTSGTVLLDGEPASQIPVQTLRRRVGMVFQTAALFDGAVIDNTLFGPRLRRERLDEESFAGELLERVGLPRDFAGKAVGELSGGEAQRVSLARALANNPEVLLLDEPTASLDPAASAQVERLLVRLAAETELTSLFVTHNLDQARRVGDRGLLLVDGRVVEQGPLTEILADPETDAMRLFIEGRLTGDAASPAREAAAP